MAKIKRKMKWDDCPHALFPFGKGVPLCSYGMKLSDHLTVKDFKPCMPGGKCRKEEVKKMGIENDGNHLMLWMVFGITS